MNSELWTISEDGKLLDENGNHILWTSIKDRAIRDALIEEILERENAHHEN